MDIESGVQLGQYRLESKIGEGGMGVVWEATDTRLNRKVAVKFLPESFAGQPERLERFNREARVLASMNHPHIAGIYGLEDHDGAPFLIMELVPGADLAKRITQGPLPVEEALEAARQVADALEVAHENGIVHRDLKPANIQLGPDGTVKVLDFGLAKALEIESGSSSMSMSPTLTTPATMEGTILGTAAYMSPEQAKGKSVDRRADIWAFGVVLYEMLTGKRPFLGDGVSETLASVIMSAPSLELLPESTPAGVRRLISRCLEKDPRRRLRDIGEARFLLEEALAGHDDLASVGPDSLTPKGRRGVSPWLAAAAALGLALAASAGVFWLSPKTDEVQKATRRFRLPVETPMRGSTNGTPIAISPDGTRLAFISGQQLWLQRLDRLEPEVINSVTEPEFVFWSPDSRWLGIASRDGLWKVPAEGGEVLSILDQAGNLSGGSGASWTEDDRIVLTRGDGALYEVSARGGDLKLILEVDLEKENDFHQPVALPGNRGVIFVSHTKNSRPDRMELFADGKRELLLDLNGQDIWDPAYSPSGHILYRRQPSNAGIWALPFSIQTLKVTGEPFMVATGGDLPSVSSDGTLAHVSGSRSRMTEMVWLDRKGETVEVIGQPQEQWPFPALSPDGRFIAIAATDNESRSLWIHDVERGSRTLGASETGRNAFGDWSPDGGALVFNSTGFAMDRQVIGNLGDRTEIGKGFFPTYSPDGRYLLISQQQEGIDWDLFYKEVGAEDEWSKLFDGPATQIAARVSPDGKFVAYTSSETGSNEVYIREFPSGAGLWQVSVDGGDWPRWSRSGDRIYYVKEETIFEVDVNLGPPLRLGRARAVVQREPLDWSLIFGWPAGFDVSPDGERFLVCRPVAQQDRSEGIIVVENWLAESEHP